MATDLTASEVYVLQKEITASRLGDWLFPYCAVPSRNARHSGNHYVVDLLIADFERIGVPLVVSRQGFRLNGAELSNVQAVLPPTGGKRGVVIVSAHLDSTAIEDVGYDHRINIAPGADDDASGVAGALLAAAAIVQLTKLSESTAPRREIRFVLFNAEEETQAGSTVYAAEARMKRDNIMGVYQMDMIGHAAADEKSFTIYAGCPDAAHVQDGSVRLADLLKRLCPAVSPNIAPTILLKQGSSGDSSDHVSFHGEMYPACLVTEDSDEANPVRHTAKDLPAGLNFVYAADIARVVAAAAWYQATR